MRHFNESKDGNHKSREALKKLEGSEDDEQLDLFGSWFGGPKDHLWNVKAKFRYLIIVALASFFAIITYAIISLIYDHRLGNELIGALLIVGVFSIAVSYNYQKEKTILLILYLLQFLLAYLSERSKRCRREQTNVT
jgi:hypothetical protein